MSYGKRQRLADKNAVDDLVMLDKIEEGAITNCLANRYGQDWIYTSIGPVLIAINPFKRIEAIYTDAKIREYKGKKSYELPPHVYSLADEAYSNMISYRENQCVIITGESGSGKFLSHSFLILSHPIQALFFHYCFASSLLLLLSSSPLSLFEVRHANPISHIPPLLNLLNLFNCIFSIHLHR